MEHTQISEQLRLAEEIELNLSDFAFFYSVIKNKEAYESILSIIMEDPHLKLKEVRAEEVVLNRIGKRAIRLDAWALDETDTQYNLEMQNDTVHDDVRKRSRYYQGMLDTPILKAGRKTRYKHLPSTVIIFITQEDVFKRDLVKYTFSEQCEEIPGLGLNDGTRKIFLNMSSKNGPEELVSLLQYMKDTRLSNPQVTVQDERILKLDSIVHEVKQSEEWEAVRMSILSRGLERGEEIGKKIGEATGIRTALLAVLEAIDTVPEQLREILEAEQDPDVLKTWFKQALRVSSLQEFQKYVKTE